MLFRVTALVLACIAAAPAVRANPCSEPAQAAEQAFDLPPRLLAAIGIVETGRRSANGETEAWPWSVNAAGRGYFLPDPAQAIALVASLQAIGIQSIDVGCFQINLFYHQDAFRTLEQAFDPAQNAMAAGRFLRALRDTSGTWGDAVARYHSANPALGIPYRQQVWARWLGTTPELQPTLSRVSAAVMVIVPGGKAPTPLHLGRQRLPAVFTPSR